MDKVNNWTNLIPKEYKNNIKVDKNFKNHLILPCSMILSIGSILKSSNHNKDFNNLVLKRKNTS